MNNDACHNEIWNRLRNGDRDALLCLYNTFYLGLVNYGLKLTGDRSLTMDCITQLLLRFWDKRQSLPPVRNLRTYLTSCLRNELFTELRSEGTRLRHFRAFQHFFSETVPSYEECLVEAQTNLILKDRLQQALSRLTPREKELLRLKFFEDQDYEEIARQCNITRRTAYNIIHSALKTLKAGFAARPNSGVTDWTIMALAGLLLAQYSG